MIGSAIIPCWNEERTIGSLLALLDPKEVEIIVVCNGCKDDTAKVARSFEGVKVLETTKPGKTNALNLGDRAASFFPRFYIDSDIRVDTEALRKVSRVLHSGTILVASPRLTWSTPNPLIRSYFEVWSELPYARESLVGSGFYALSQAARARFGEFPDLFSEDEFIRRQFPPHQRASLPDCEFQMRCPRSLRGLIRVRARHYQGNLQLEQTLPDSHKHTHELKDSLVALLSLFRRPGRWPSCLVYIGVTLVARLLAFWWSCTDQRTWAREDDV